MTIRIRKIDIDDLRSDGPPSWGKITAVVNGVEVALRLDDNRIARLTAFVTPLAMELVEEITKGPQNVVVEIKRPA